MSWRDPKPPPPLEPVAPWRAMLGRWWGMDLRTLALLRVVLALLVLADLPRLVIAMPWAGWSLAVSWVVLILLFVCSVALLLGWHARASALAAWVLLFGIQLGVGAIQVQVMHGLMLLWLVFLPCGARFSIDSAMNTQPASRRENYLSVVTAVVLLQVVLFYAWGALGVVFGHHAASPLVFGALTLLPLLLLSPWMTAPLRVVVIPTLALMHLAVALATQVDLTLLVMWAALLAFMPGDLWEWIMLWLHSPERLGVRIYFDGDCGFCARTSRVLHTFFLLPATCVMPAQNDPEVNQQMLERNSWIVIDHSGKLYDKFEAVVYVLSLSPLASWAVPLLKSKLVMRAGTRVYEWVANHRDAMSRMTWFLQPRAVRPQVSLPVQIIALVLFVVLSVQSTANVVRGERVTLLPIDGEKKSTGSRLVEPSAAEGDAQLR